MSGTSLACSTALKGSIRYSNTSNTLEYCNSTAWVSAGPSWTVFPAFSVRKSMNQTVATNTLTTVTWQTEEYDTNNNFASNRFTPTIPGKYQINASIQCSDNASYCEMNILKNGVLLAYGGSPYPYVPALAATVVDMNGTSDYLEIQAQNGGGVTITASVANRFSGILISMAGGSTGGSATPAGISGSIQFNSAGALAGRSDIIVDPSGSVGIGTGAPRAALDVSGTVKMAGTGAEACVSNTLGTFRFNPMTGVPQICR